MILRPRDIKDELEVISSGLPQMDALLGLGGFPRKFLTMFSGNAGVGKTTIAAQAMAQAQRDGHKVLYVETDFKFVPRYIKSLGVDLSKLTVIQDEVGETVLTEMLEELRTGKYTFFVIDNMTKITPREEIEKDFDSQTIGKQAMLIQRFLRKLKPLCHEHNMAGLLLNHERIDFMNGGKIKTPGGESIQEDCAIWIRLNPTGDYVKIGDRVVGKKIRARVWHKNQVASTEGMQKILEVRMGEGFSATADLLENAIERGIIRKDGGSYYFGDEKIAYGQTKLREWVKTHEEDIKAQIG